MKYKAVFLPIANQDIISINDALTDYPYKAKRVFQEMDDKIADLEAMPYMWPVYQANPKYRRAILEDHLLFYIVDESEHKVRIYRILYDKMNVPEHLD